MIDIHTHLYWESYDADREAVIARAHAAGVEKMFVIGCTVEESRQCVALAERYPEVYASVGIHPQTFNEVGISKLESWVSELKSLAQNKKVVAIGECGLEYFSHQSTPQSFAAGQATNNLRPTTITDEQKSVQKAGFLAQIALAEELHLPLILHCRPSVGTQDAYEDMFRILQDSKIKNQDSKYILHCYMGDMEITNKFLTLPNVYFSFTGNITYPVKKALVGLPAEATRGALLAGTKNDLTETVKMIPLERIFVETDCPFLAPQSHRGERNEPAYVVDVVRAIATLQSKTIDEVEQAILHNFTRVFHAV